MSNVPLITSSSSESEGSVVETVGNAVGAVSELFSGVAIPAPIKKNAWKAFSQLCSALIDIPVASLEGIAKERREEALARVKIISATADQIARSLHVDSAYANAAVRKYGSKIVREQINLDKISDVAASQLNSDAARGTPEAATVEAEINDDWLSAFEREATQKNTEEMQLLFGRILAGEIRKPTSFAIKTVKLISQIDSETAAIFKRFCAVAIALHADDTVWDVRVAALDGNANTNSLRPYGLSYDHLNILNEFGLITAEYHSSMSYETCVVTQGTVGGIVHFEGADWVFIPAGDRPTDAKLTLHGVALTRAGRELMGIVDIEPNENYSKALKTHLSNAKLTMERFQTN